ncbi:MAG: ATP-binding protein [Bacteroidia bacterium]|nr:MAG: ATP-binding protein [Bacteroidia bacterium]
MIERELEHLIRSKINKGKAIILLGPRQTGKTTLMLKIVGETGEYLFLNCDDPVVREQLENANIETLRQLLGKYKLVLMDEAQRIKNTGLTLKLITDTFKDVQLLVSGSSSFELADKINEPLTGRKWEYFLYPVSWKELTDYAGHLKALQQLETRILYGMYPDVITNPGEEKEILKQLTDSFLYRDLLAFQGIRRPELVLNLLRALALQLGNEVSYNELSRLLQVDKKTVSSYIDLLEKAFIVFRLMPYRRNLRTEIGKSRKIYFYDNGIRNALAANFNPLNLRQDTGALWENFLIAERMKRNHYSRKWINSYFWRTTAQQEIDYLEESEGHLSAYEFKWSASTLFRIPGSFLSTYPEASTTVVSRENFTDFILPNS